MLDYLDDIASDLSVFHRIDSPHELAGPAYFKLAMRLYCYAGVMQQRVIAEQQDDGPTGRPDGSARPSGGGEWNPGTKATLQADPALKGLFSFG